MTHAFAASRDMAGEQEHQAAERIHLIFFPGEARIDRLHRVYPPGNWPAETWQQELLGYPSRERDMSVAAVVFTCPPTIAAAIDPTKGPCVPAPGKGHASRASRSA